MLQMPLGNEKWGSMEQEDLSWVEAILMGGHVTFQYTVNMREIDARLAEMWCRCSKPIGSMYAI